MTDLNLEPAELSKRGIAAARAGRNDEARDYLLAAVEADERNEQAWLWLGGVMTEVEDQIVCLENALTLNPDNTMAERKLNQLYARRGAQPTPAVNPAAPASQPFTPTQDLHLTSPAATQTLADPPFGVLPWDLPSTHQQGDTSSLPYAQGDYASPNPWANSSAESNHELFGSTSAPRYSPGGHPEQLGNSEWEQPGTQHMASPFGYNPDSELEEHLPRYTPGGHPDQRSTTERGQLDSYEFAASPSASANPFLSPQPTIGYGAFDTGASATSTSSASYHADTQFNSAFNVPAEEMESDERLDCPYCGWHTQIADDRCPNCGGDLYIRARPNENRSSALWAVVILWVVRALKTAFNLGQAIIIAEVVRRQLQSLSSGVDSKTAAQYGLTAANLSDATVRAETSLAIYYGVLIAIYAVLAIGSWTRARIFYQLGLAVIVLSVLGDIASYLFDPIKSPTLLIGGIVIAIAQFLTLTRADGDFLMQKQRIMEPSYRGEASAIGFYNLGTTYQKAGFTALAAKAWRRSIGLNQGDTRTRAALALAYNKMKRYDLAMQELTEAIKITPNEIRLYNLLAISQARQGDFEAAHRTLKTALQIEPGNQDTIETSDLVEQEAKKANRREPKKPAPQETKKVAS